RPDCGGAPADGHRRLPPEGLAPDPEGLADDGVTIAAPERAQLAVEGNVRAGQIVHRGDGRSPAGFREVAGLDDLLRAGRAGGDGQEQRHADSRPGANQRGPSVTLKPTRLLGTSGSSSKRASTLPAESRTWTLDSTAYCTGP